jgi:hypothetical protein
MDCSDTCVYTERVYRSLPIHSIPSTFPFTKDWGEFLEQCSWEKRNSVTKPVSGSADLEEICILFFPMQVRLGLDIVDTHVERDKR